jgi:carboxyl-terminal processing protease
MDNSLLRRPIAGLVALVALAALGGCQSAGSAGQGGDPDLALYRSAVNRVRSSYVEPVGEDKLVVNALKGMLNGLDPHSDYMTEVEYHEMLDDTQGEFAGIGAELTRDDNRPKIITPIDDTPAARAGIKPGDVILRINGKSTDGMSLKDVVDLLRGDPGTAVTITIARAAEHPFEVTLTRAIIHVASVKFHLEPGRIAYARITNFGEKTQSDLVGALNKMTAEAGGKLDGLVLDLRNDPGGLLDQAIDVAGDFLDGGTVVSTRGRIADDDQIFPAPSNGDRLRGVPIVVLINGASASASEIVAGALQDRHRAELIGTRSFGKGSVQTIIPLDGKGALRLTTARYYTPSGRSIQGQGITPDRIVLPPENQRFTQADIIHEADLRGALSNPGSTGAAAPRAPATTATGEGVDENEATIDPTLIGTPGDYQLSVAVKELHDRAAQRPDALRAQLPASQVSGNR